VAAEDVPAAVTKALEDRYPKATIKEVMEKQQGEGRPGDAGSLRGGGGYRGRNMEIEVSPTGKFLKESKAESDKK
jgi:hypothetical protein